MSRKQFLILAQSSFGAGDVRDVDRTCGQQVTLEQAYEAIRRDVLPQSESESTGQIRFNSQPFAGDFDASQIEHT